MDNAQLCHWGIKGQKWGIRRFQNKDGSLTPVGRKRYADDNVHEDYKNAHTRTSVRTMSTTELNEKNQRLEAERKYNALMPKEKSNVEKAKKAIDETSGLVKTLKNIEQDTRPKNKKIKMDLSSMSDAEMRNAINRELLERQYNDMFAQTASASKGREYVNTVLEIAGTVLTAGSSALGIALAIKELKG